MNNGIDFSLEPVLKATETAGNKSSRKRKSVIKPMVKPCKLTILEKGNKEKWTWLKNTIKTVAIKRRRKRNANGSKLVFNDDQDEPSDCNDLVTNEPDHLVYDDTATNEIEPSVCKRKNKKSEPGKDENGRSFNYQYTLINENGHEELVCQKFFLSTLGYSSNKVVFCLFNKLSYAGSLGDISSPDDKRQTCTEA